MPILRKSPQPLRLQLTAIKPAHEIEAALFGTDEEVQHEAAARTKRRDNDLARCADAEDRAAILSQYIDEVERDDRRRRSLVAWYGTATGRLVEALTGGASCDQLDPQFADGTVPDLWRWWCPCCQRAVCEATYGDAEVDAEVPEKALLVDHRYGERIERDEARVACSLGCTGDSLADACRSFISATEGRALADALAESRAAVSLARLRDAFTPQGWLVGGELWADDGLTLLVGRRGGSKTFFAMMAAIGVAAGATVLGHPTTRARVLLVLLEGTRRDWARRIEQLARGMGVTLNELDGWLDVYDDTLRVTDADSVNRLRAMIASHRYGAIVVDNLSEIGAGSENDNSAMGAGVSTIRRIAYDLGVAVILLHHAGHNGESRGASAIEDKADDVLKIVKASDALDAIITVDRRKTKCGAGPLGLRYRLVGGGTDGSAIVPRLIESNDDSAPNGADGGAALSSALAALEACIRDSPGAGLNEICRAVGRSGKAPVKRDLAMLVERGRVRMDDDKGYWPADVGNAS